MRDVLLELLQSNQGALTIQDIILNFVIAGILGLVIYLSYRISHAGGMYSTKFNVSLVMLTLITTLVMNVIGNNIALSLGMVGALSIVRFRTAIKDSRDTAYIFWAIATGICCGVQEYIIVSIGSGVIFLFLILFGAVKSNERYLLIIRGESVSENNIEQEIEQLFLGKVRYRVKNISNGSLEYIYEISEKQLQAADKKVTSVATHLSTISGIKTVNIVSQNDEMSR
ncbi:DUF4956 domain-containing protein [Enterococcus saccharolyticus]|uniref:DUF4956 domain-containing protein n=1 Tax=Enterococcus saccharolyticus subsp. saccharolyticus ATCC 43076 TaxID=1139996 RepID=S0JQ10_9ENTE|nr:DUF4956 domain-containing protein [Enterococcus saccharolyticus]EOT30003.1 hypothetical protein OMQ_00695 [Enterococcus saccharolyticus subsp. saccharolyticus ATCC 43076]EOT80549.1 hypothetical protein I572_01076 [Enterococcus saccharolyticus subsp. saccharolyticus ATCC 43076]OJG90088.1 hypothetical protein RV16_GL001898 [Enterococcus saccharolyticus]